MRKFMLTSVLLLVTGTMADAGPIRERIAERRAARQDCKSCESSSLPAFPLLSQVPVVQQVGVIARDVVKVIPATYYSLPFSNCPNGQCPRR